MRDKRLIPVSIIFILLGAASFFFFHKDIQNYFQPQPVNSPGGAISRTQPVLTCGEGDKACELKNEKIKANKLDGIAAKFVTHQCSGPRACPTPNEEDTQTIISAIRSYTKQPKLELIRVTGVTPAGLIYYCAEDERCWSYSTKTKSVILIDNTVATNSSESADVR
jgi:hypothetical protein